MTQKSSHSLESGQKKEVRSIEQSREEKSMQSSLQTEDRPHQSKRKSSKVCFRCGRLLKSEESMILGFGPTCYKKWVEEKPKLKRLIREVR